MLPSLSKLNMTIAAGPYQNKKLKRDGEFTQLVCKITENVQQDQSVPSPYCFKGEPQLYPSYDFCTWKEKNIERSKLIADQDSLVKKHVLKALQPDPLKIFMPQDTHLDVKISTKTSNYECTQKLAGALFLSFDDNRTVEQAGNHMITEYKKILSDFAKDAFHCTHNILQDDQVMNSVELTLALQYIDKDYNPIVESIHMDNHVGMYEPDCAGTRYGRPAEEQDINSLIMSFCADKNLDDTPSNDVTANVNLYGCVTVYFGGIPVVKPDALLKIANAVKSEYEKKFFNYTQLEMFDWVASYFNRATRAALESMSDGNIKRMFDVYHTGCRQWSTANTLAFHRSPGKEEVIATRKVGDEILRMRGVCAMTADGKVGITEAPFEHTFQVDGGVEYTNRCQRKKKINLDVRLTISK